MPVVYPQRTMEPVPKSYGVTSTYRMGSDAVPAIKAAFPATSMLPKLATHLDIHIPAECGPDNKYTDLYDI